MWETREKFELCWPAGPNHKTGNRDAMSCEDCVSARMHVRACVLVSTYIHAVSLPTGPSVHNLRHTRPPQAVAQNNVSDNNDIRNSNDILVTTYHVLDTLLEAGNTLDDLSVHNNLVDLVLSASHLKDRNRGSERLNYLFKVTQL